MDVDSVKLEWYTDQLEKKSRKTLLDQARKMLKATGYDEVSLVSLSTCDYSDIQGLVKDLIEEHGKNNVSVALPSIRVDAFSVDLLKEIQKVRKTGLTFCARGWFSKNERCYK